MEAMKICKECLLDDNFPGISFDKEEICKFCRSAKNWNKNKELKEKNKEKFLDLVKRYRGKNNYDCLVAYSGGKDSTYTLHLMKNKYDLNPLVFSFDNWFQSDKTQQNINNVIKKLNVDYLMIRPSFENLKKMIHVCISDGFNSMKALERASAICTTCLSLIRFTSLKIAIEKSIPFVVFGLSPGQAPIGTAVFRSNPSIIKKMQDAIYKPLYERLGQNIKAYFLEDKHFNNQKDFPYSINPLAFEDYDEEAIIKIARGYGWIKPKDTDANSTNCLLNSLANEIHFRQHGFDPYAFEILTLVREGCMTRDEGIKRLSMLPNKEMIDSLRNELEMEENHLR